MNLPGWFALDGSPGCGGSGPEWQQWNDWEYHDNPADDLMDEAENVTRKLAAEVLKNLQCPDLDRLEKVLLEASLLDVEDVIPPLEEKYVELLDQRNVIEGTIECSIILPRKPPVTWNWEGGARFWSERHEISLAFHLSPDGSVDLGLGDFEGKDIVTTEFGEARYRLDIPGTGCDFEVYKTETLRGAPSPGHFKVDSVAPAGQIQPGSDNVEVDWEYTGLDPLTCNRKPDINWTYEVPCRGQNAEEYSLDTTEG